MNALVRHAKTVDALAQLKVRSSFLGKAELGAWCVSRLQDLGPTYVKIGQFVSSRQDIFGPEFSAPFAALRDSVRPIPPKEVAALIAAECDGSAFFSIDLEAPLASASIGQVHAAVLRDGKRVVIKVRRPGIEAVIREDVAFIYAALDVLTQLNGSSEDNYADAVDMLRDVEAFLLQEVDFRREAAAMGAFGRQHAGDKDVRVPGVVAALCTDSVIVMERIDSRGLDTFIPTTNEERGADERGERKRVALRVMDVFVSQLIDGGLVHGDPHSGNVGVDAAGRIVLYDFGNVISLTREERQRMKEMIYLLLVGNNRAVSDSLKKLGVRILDEAAMSAYIDVYRDYMRTIDVGALRSIGTYAGGGGGGGGPGDKVPLKLTDKFLRLIRVYGMLEGTCKAIHPEFNYFDLLDDYIDDLFFDEEFLAFKVGEDVKLLRSGFNPFAPQAPPPPPQTPPTPPTPQKRKRGIDLKDLGYAALVAFAVLKSL